MTDLSSTPLTELVSAFISTLGDPRRQASTARAYPDDLRQLCELVADDGVRDLGALTRPVLLHWIRFLVASGYANGTVRRRVSAVQAFFRYLETDHGRLAQGIDRAPNDPNMRHLG